MDQSERQNVTDLKRGLSEFLPAIFEPNDVIEIRLIETWTDSGKQKSRFVDRRWLTGTELLKAERALRNANKRGANLLFGVNPRRRAGSKKEDVGLCRTLWADMDGVGEDESFRWSALPAPSVVVNSGHGVHLYWKLKKPVHLTTSSSCSHVEAVLRGMYRELGSDSVQDVSRLLRLPGSLNVKNFRNGTSPVPCRLVECQMDRTYDFLDFQHLAEEPRCAPPGESLPSVFAASRGVTLPTSRLTSRIRGLTRLLSQNVPDRSKRDFFVVTKLLELGCSVDEVATLVRDHSKFQGNESYLLRTIQNARAAVRHSMDRNPN